MATPVFEPYILPGSDSDPDRSIRPPAPGHRAHRQGFRPGDARVVPHHGGAGYLGDSCSTRSVFAALDPRYGLSYLFSGGLTGFLVLGGVFLCVTGAEALYADMGHFGPRPIRLSWLAVVFPSLVLNYAGQAALVLEGAPTDGNIFYRLCPQPLLIPLIILATVATIIASQSIITGAFSMTRQAILLGWLPRLVDQADFG